ncbi:odorant receptor 49b-like isoform X2 [Linepithema humile]|uniref:odorant receptor 49b-like isoform X2 n=1 Tax=Linepithema humile TaxID=83485 RepID=UPI00351F089B
MHFDAYREMTNYIEQYFNLNRILLLTVGLWPYQQSKLVRFQVISFFSILTSFIVFQFTKFMTAECTINLIIKILCCALFFIMSLITYNSFLINNQTVKYSLEQFRHIYNELKDANEIAIIKKYGYYAKRYTTRIILIATGTMLIVYLKFSCGMFTIASYRIKQAMRVNILQKNPKNTIIIYKKMIYAVDIHRKAMNYAEHVINNFEGSFFSLITISVCCLSLNLFEIFQTMSLKNIDQFLLHVVFIGIIVLYMFLANYAGQEITDHHNHVFSTAYSVQWYTAPLHTQKLILFLLQRTNKTFSLNIGGLFVASLQCFASLTSASMSYFTVIYSTQQ